MAMVLVAMVLVMAVVVEVPNCASIQLSSTTCLMTTMKVI